jgi:hypothetical protein
MKYVMVIAMVFIIHAVHAQLGCIDPQASNYNASATINDGSCLYNATNYSLTVKDSLPTALSEISGMCYWNGKLYVHNDSGNPAVLFEIDTVNGIISKEIYIEGNQNTDWEDITQDATHFYIADVGNNGGDRTDLRIIKFPKSGIGANYFDTIFLNQIEIINFTYPDQVDFTYNLNMTRFDCEAVAYRNGKLYLFTKNWTLGACVHYTLPATAGNYTATKVDSINTVGTLITAADFASNKQLMLLGYKNSGTAEASLWFVYDFDQTDSFLFTGNKRKIVVGDALLVGQVEGLCFVDSSGGFVSNERFNPIAPINISQKLYSFGTTQWFPYQLNTQTDEHKEDPFNLVTTVSNQKVDIYFTLQSDDQIHITLFGGKGKKLRQKHFTCSSGKQHVQLDNVDLSPGIYYVLLQNKTGEKKISKIFLQNR